uniref:Uncharacterized protein n=1 Tax=Nomascus leucogenys TaxID=61853 RepID=A0A2I3GV64_NOMLE
MVRNGMCAHYHPRGCVCSSCQPSITPALSTSSLRVIWEVDGLGLWFRGQHMAQAGTLTTCPST